MQKKKYPSVVAIKKSLIAGVAFIALLIVFLIVHNLYQDASHSEADPQGHPQGVQRIADPTDSEWAQNQKVEKSSQAEPGRPLKTAAVDKDNQALSTGENVSSENPDVQSAMAAPITSNQLIAEGSMGTPVLNDAPQTEEKQAFIDNADLEGKVDSLGASVKNSSSMYTLHAGTLIPGILLTGVSADLPKYVIGQVRCPVYDSPTGRHLLIPQGAKLTGMYDAQVAYGQERLLVTWQRLIFPNGQSIELKGMPGVDAGGYAGFKDQVDNHYGSLFKGALLTSLFGMGAMLSQPNVPKQSLHAASVGGAYAQSVANAVLTTGNLIADKQIAVQPTLSIRPGYTFNIMVTQDIVFSAPYAG